MTESTPTPRRRGGRPAGSTNKKTGDAKGMNLDKAVVDEVKIDEVKETLEQLDGTTESAVKVLTGMTSEELDDLGGFPVAGSSDELNEQSMAAGINDAQDRWNDDGGNTPPDSSFITIEFLETGLTVQGSVRRKGEVLKIKVGSPEYIRTVDKSGDSWLSLRNNSEGQRAIWGKVMFREAS